MSTSEPSGDGGPRVPDPDEIAERVADSGRFTMHATPPPGTSTAQYYADLHGAARRAGQLLDRAVAVTIEHFVDDGRRHVRFVVTDEAAER